MKIRDLLNHIDTFAPFSLAEDWDNSGLLAGSPNDEIIKTAVSLDSVTEAVKQAHTQGCNVLVAHHPLIFRTVKRITEDSEQGRALITALRLGVNIIAVHTNWDKAYGGVNDTLSALIALNDTQPLDDFGISGLLNSSMTLPDFAKLLKDSWGLSHVDIYAGNPDAEIQKVSLCGGSGAEFWHCAKSNGSDIYVTADMKYHEISDAVNDGMIIALCEHGEMERASIPALAAKIKESGSETVIINVKALPEMIKF